MKKTILALIISALLALGNVSSFAQEESAVAAVDGNVNISVETQAEENTPILIFILPAIKEGDTDVTTERVQGLNSAQLLKELNVEYIAVEYAEADGSITHNCVMKNSLATGLCHVVLSYIGKSCYIAGSFEHVGEEDKAELLRSLNEADKDSCESIIDEDINGKLDEDGQTRLSAKEILRKSSADVLYYSSLEKKAEFHELLYKLKGDEDFDLPGLVKAFNETGVWMRLQLEDDTLSVLKAYNGEEDGKYWNLPIDEEDDFLTAVKESERTAILGKIKNGKYEKSSVLEEDFRNELVMAMFRSVTIREELAKLISEDGKYADEFSKVREIIAAADLDEYKTALLYNNVLDENTKCITGEDIEKLFEASIPESSGNSGSGGGGGGGSSTKKPLTSDKESIKYEDDVTVEPAKPEIRFFPYKDIEETHWAYGYIKKLHNDGTVNGVSTEEFAPEKSIARQDFVKILIGAMNIEKSESAPEFTDVSADSYYAPFVMAAFEKGLVTGTGDGAFGVGSFIKREDAAVIMNRVLSVYNADIKEKDIKFQDYESAASYAKEAIVKVANAGVFGGDENGNFNPKDSLSRAEACAILCRLAEIIKEV